MNSLTNNAPFGKIFPGIPVELDIDLETGFSPEVSGFPLNPPISCIIKYMKSIRPATDLMISQVLWRGAISVTFVAFSF